MEILTLDDDILNKPTKKVTKFGKDLNKLIHIMLRVTKENKALGLAANQIGVSMSLFVTCVDVDRVFINPIIESVSDECETKREGCLSNRDQFIKKSRPKKVTVRFQGPNRQVLIQTFEGLLARVILHECEHLAGKNYLDEE